MLCGQNISFNLFDMMEMPISIQFIGKGFHDDSVIRTPLIFAGPGIKQQRIGEPLYHRSRTAEPKSPIPRIHILFLLD